MRRFVVFKFPKTRRKRGRSRALGGKSHNFLFSKMKNICCQVDREGSKYGKWAETLHICRGLAVADNSKALGTEVEEMPGGKGQDSRSGFKLPFFFTGLKKA